MQPQGLKGHRSTEKNYCNLDPREFDRNTKKKVKIYFQYRIKSFDCQLLFKDTINNSPPGNNKNRVIKNSDRQNSKALAT